MRRTSPIALFATVLVALVTLLSGCGGTDDNADAPTELEGSWTLETLGGAKSDPAVVTQLNMNEGQASGNAGVNTFTGSYEAPEDGTLTFGPLATTMMAGPDAAMQQEQAFLKALADTKTFTTEDGALVLMDADGNKLAVLTAAGNG